MNKKLYRSPKDGILLGIGSGLGHYFEKDPVIIRLVIVAAALLTQVWPVLVIYAIMFLIIPVDPAQAKVQGTQEPKDVTSQEPSAKSQESQEPSAKSQEVNGEEAVPIERMDGAQNM